ncbi:MAG: IS5 family transposase, partial [Hyphomicrobium sp.]|nr:IS5 family transposase [Hyphomicrobium sp.]
METGQLVASRGGYNSDLTDEKWALIEPLLPAPKPGGRPRKTSVRRVVDAILYLVKNGCHWRNLPRDFPPPGTCYTYFRAWRATGVLKRLQQTLVKKVRRAAGRKSTPSIASIDSQSVKSGKFASSERGYDGGKRVKGRKRHIAVDTLGLPLAISVTSANTHDKVGGKRVVERMARWLKHKSPKKLYADGGYGGAPFAEFVRDKMNANVRIAGNIAQKVKAFVPLPQRWVVERTFAWLGDYRRLDKDQERLTRNSVAMIRWASVSFMLNRLSEPRPDPWGPSRRRRAKARVAR